MKRKLIIPIATIALLAPTAVAHDKPPASPPWKLIYPCLIMGEDDWAIWLKEPGGITYKRFDPEGSGYDYETACASGMLPNSELHWGSLDPRTGMVLKGRNHKTWNLMEAEEKRLGNRIIKKDGHYYSVKGGDLVAANLPKQTRSVHVLEASTYRIRTVHEKKRYKLHRRRWLHPKLHYWRTHQ